MQWWRLWGWAWLMMVRVMMVLGRSMPHIYHFFYTDKIFESAVCGVRLWQTCWQNGRMTIIKNGMDAVRLMTGVMWEAAAAVFCRIWCEPRYSQYWLHSAAPAHYTFHNHLHRLHLDRFFCVCKILGKFLVILGTLSDVGNYLVNIHWWGDEQPQNICNVFIYLCDISHLDFM